MGAFLVLGETDYTGDYPAVAMFAFVTDSPLSK